MILGNIDLRDKLFYLIFIDMLELHPVNFMDFFTASIFLATGLSLLSKRMSDS
jgi:hypothetical protein